MSDNFIKSSRQSVWQEQNDGHYGAIFLSGHFAQKTDETVKNPTKMAK